MLKGKDLAEILRAGEWRSASFLEYLDKVELEREVCAKHSVSLLRPRSYATRLFWRHTWVNHPRMMKGPRSPKQDRWCVAGASRAACRTNDDGWSLCSVSAPLVARAARRDAVQHPSCVLAVGIGTHLLCFHRRRAARPANRHHVGLSGAGRGRAGEGRLPPLEGVEPPGRCHSFPEVNFVLIKCSPPVFSNSCIFWTGRQIQNCI